MRVFISAMLILLLLSTGVIANGIILHDRLCRLIDGVLLLPDSAPADSIQYSDAMTELDGLWDKTRPLTVLTVSSARIEHIDRAIGNIKTSWETEDDTAYRQARGDLLLLLRRLRAMESCSISAIL